MSRRTGHLGERREVWWCLDGDHIDENHSASVDCCSRCGGTCERRSTSVVTDRRRPPRRTSAQVAAAKERKRKANAVKTYQGKPFQPTTEVTEADAHSFGRSIKKATFLSDRQREQLLRGDSYPVISFPRCDGMPPVLENEYLEVTEAVSIVIVGYRTTKTDFVANYQVEDSRTPSLRLKAKLPADPKSEIGMAKTEYEPQPISRKETTEMARLSRAEEIASLLESEAQIENNLKKLEADSTSEVTFDLRRALGAMTKRRERLEKVDSEKAI